MDHQYENELNKSLNVFYENILRVDEQCLAEAKILTGPHTVISE